jgi:hypothetical protein
MDVNEAGELAQARGYGGKVTAFGQMCRADNPDKAFNQFGIAYDRETQKYFDVRSVMGG